jgi:hypothetical protein
MENENLPDENLEDEEEEKEDVTPAPTPSPAPPTVPVSAPPESKGQALIEGSKASGEVKNRLTYKQRFERRERIKEFLDKGITNATKIAGLLGVTDVTVRKDISIITKERKTGLTRESAPEHVGTLLGQMEEIIKNSTMDYLNITGNDPKSNAAKASLLQTALRAIMAKSQLLMQTGVVPPDITTMDKIIEAQMIESKAKAILDPKIAEVVTNADSRRKVLDVVEKLRGVSPEVAAVVMERLDAKEEQDKIDKEHPTPEPPKETPQQPSPSEKPVA